jgi:hypothetical protein
MDASGVRKVINLSHRSARCQPPPEMERIQLLFRI